MKFEKSSFYFENSIFDPNIINIDLNQSLITHKTFNEYEIWRSTFYLKNSILYPNIISIDISQSLITHTK